MAKKYVENGEADKAFYTSDTKKNIFLIGDSIRLGYCKYVKAELEESAEVFYVDDNCRSTQYVIFSLNTWKNMFDDPDKIDLVHFNCGHWDAAHFSGTEFPLTSEQEYEKNLHMIIFLIRKLFKNAKIVFATTTPMNPDNTSVRHTNPRTTEQIKRYNEIACEVMAKENIEVNDLFAFTRDFDKSLFADSCHFTDAASQIIAKQVAKHIQ